MSLVLLQSLDVEFYIHNVAHFTLLCILHMFLWSIKLWLCTSDAQVYTERATRYTSELVLVYKDRSTPWSWCLLTWGKICQGNNFNGIFNSTVSLACVVKLGSRCPLVNIFLGQRSSKGVYSIWSCTSSPTLLESKCWQRWIRLLVLGQWWWHPAVIGVAEDEAFLGAGLWGFCKSFLKIDFNC